jgi:hypothetical protein
MTVPDTLAQNAAFGFIAICPEKQYSLRIAPVQQDCFHNAELAVIIHFSTLVTGRSPLQFG